MNVGFWILDGRGWRSLAQTAENGKVNGDAKRSGPKEILNFGF